MQELQEWIHELQLDHPWLYLLCLLIAMGSFMAVLELRHTLLDDIKKLADLFRKGKPCA